MKKMRVYTIIKYSRIALLILFILGIIGFGLYSKFISSNHNDIPELFFVWVLFPILIWVSRLIRILKKNDFYKNIENEIIDENEIVSFVNPRSRWVLFFLIQILFSFTFILDYFSNLLFDLSVDNSFYLSPTIIFILSSFIFRINKSEDDLIIYRRRDRIRTEDLEVLDKKVNLGDWVKNDPVLQRDKVIFGELVLINKYYLISYFDDSLKCNKDFILNLPSINYSVLNWVSHFHIKFQESDFNDELILKIAIHSNSYELLFPNSNSKFSEIYVRKIIDIYLNNRLADANGLKNINILELYYTLKNKGIETKQHPILDSYKLCVKDEHLIAKEVEQCPYCN